MRSRIHFVRSFAWRIKPRLYSVRSFRGCFRPEVVLLVPENGGKGGYRGREKGRGYKTGLRCESWGEIMHLI